MKVLIVGSGGREHALAWVCSRSKLNPSITCTPGNGGTALIARNVDIKAENIDGIVDYVRNQHFDLTIVGPEAPLVAGLADRLINHGYRVFGPTSQAAQIEGSKAFAKQLMADTGVMTADFSVFTDLKSARQYLSAHPAPVIIKASGLAAGKGVLICNTDEVAIAAAEGMLLRDAFGSAGRKIVIEECLEGREMSLLALVDGKDFILLPPSRDYKRAYDNNEGPNTGGMGAFSPLDDVDDDMVRQIAERVFPPVLNRLCELGAPYSGCLYAGIMLTEIGPHVLEFNCRFGDPEAQAVLPMLTEDTLELMIEVAEGGLNRYMSSLTLKSLDWQSLSGSKHAVSIVAAVDGYPGSYNKDIPIERLPKETDQVIPFHAGTKLRNRDLLTSGGRVLAVTGLGDTHEEAAEIAYKAIDKVQFKDIRFRRDIGRINNVS